MRYLILLSLILPGCGHDPPDNGTAKARQSANQHSTEAFRGSLTGLYENKRGGESDRMCVVDGPEGARFALVVWGGAGRSCSGSGAVRRRGDVVVMAMAGDRACAFNARIEGNSLVFPSDVPRGCNYYCGAGASLGGAQLLRTSATGRDALKALDLVGDPLCRSFNGPILDVDVNVN